MAYNGTNRNTDRYGRRNESSRTSAGGRDPRRTRPTGPKGEPESRGWAYPDDGGGIYSAMNGRGGANPRMNGAPRTNGVPRANSNSPMNADPRMNGRAGRPYYEDPNEASMRRVRENQARHRESIRREREAREKAQRRAALKYNILLVLKLFLATFAVCAAVMAGLYFAAFYGKESKYPNVSYTYIDTQVKKVDSSLAYKNGVLYVNFTTLADRLSMSVTGGAEKMKFVLPADGAEGTDMSGSESVEFRTGSAQIWVNSQETRSESASVLRGENVWVPLSVITNYMRGLKVESDGKAVSITRIHAEGSTKENPLYEDVYFTLKSISALCPVVENSVSAGSTSAVEFISDLSEYEQYMNPSDRDGYLVLANAAHTLDEGYVPSDLTNLADTRKDGRDPQQMRLTAAKAMEAMFIEMRAAGYGDVSVTSAYRSYARQKELFTSYTNQEMAKNPALTRAQAEAIVVTYSNRPGTSEHQSGLAADLHNLPAADQAFAQKDAYKWLCENAWKFGFIERYPKDKTEITGVSFEPWHYRFVGRYHALRIKQSGVCLEEYTESLN